MDQLSNLNIVCTVAFDWYLFQLAVRLNPDFTRCNSFALLLVNKSTKSFATVIPNVITSFTVVQDFIKQLSDRPKTQLISKLFKVISKVLQNYLDI